MLRLEFCRSSEPVWRGLCGELDETCVSGVGVEYGVFCWRFASELTCVGCEYEGLCMR